MYVCKFDDEKKIKQMELPDYFGHKRSVEFDMNDPKAIRQAIKHLTPKGLQKKHKKKEAKPEAKSEVQAKFQNILTMIPKAPTKSKKKVESKKANGEKQDMDIPKVNVKPLVPIMPSPIPSPLILSPSPVSPPFSPPIMEKVIKSKPIPQKTPIISSIPKKPQQSIPLNKPQTAIKPLITTEAVFKVEAEFLQRIGAGGSMELTCPICNEANMFDPENTDKHTAQATRQCDGCGSLLRISLQAASRTIFGDLKPTSAYILKNMKKATTEIVDENQNVLTIYGLKID